jgi:Carboxypeptidase regulatory-like domain
MAFLWDAVGVVFAMQGAVVGMVRDGDSGLPLAGAVVALPDAERTTTTGLDGRYALPKVPAGPQHLAVRMIGYAPRSLHALVPAEGRLEIDVSLRSEPTRLRTVEVRAPVSLRGLDVADSTLFPDRGISMAAARNHPLLAEPDALEALVGGEVAVRPESPTGVHVRGGASDHTAYMLDGIPVLSPYHAAGVFGAWNPDALSGVKLSSAVPSFANPHALSGAITGTTRSPGDRMRAQGGASTTHFRFTVDGPLGPTGAGYLLSIRSAFPGFIVPRNEASYVHGELGDWLAKIETPLFGGRARVLGYSNENELNASSTGGADDASGAKGERNVFVWTSHSTGAEWSRALSAAAVRVVGWSVAGNASSIWAGVDGIEMTSHRRDKGLLATVEGKRTSAGVRVEQTNTSYDVRSRTGLDPSWSVDARTPVVTIFGQRAIALGKRVDVELGTSMSAARGSVYPGPRAHLRWLPWNHLTVSGSYARTHQFAQSLRNAESVVGNVFPADLFLSADAAGAPTAQSDLVVLAGEFRPSAALRVTLQGYARAFDGLVVVAPRVTGPFSTSTFAEGSGVSRGVSLEGALSAARYGLMASYGWQRTRLWYGDSSYVPDHATTHLLDGGAIFFPTPTMSVRLGARAGVGRRTSIVTGELDWEPCHLLDQGCEFGGSPHNEPGSPGATPLPMYLRVDIGVRKHWHVHVAGRDVVLAAFGTVANVFGRQNMLTYARNPATGELAEIGMRPPSPLVLGLDWRF